MKTLKGIDVSEHQEYLDYTMLSKQIDFVILREGCRQRMDLLFKNHINGFRAAGTTIPAVYHFIYALDVMQAKQEAESAIRNVESVGLPKSIYIFADFEYDTVKYAADKGVTLLAKECNEITRAFCETIEAAGYRTGIYCNLDYYKNMYYQELLDKYPVWLCDLSSSPKYPCMIWQYSWEGYDWNKWYMDDGSTSVVDKATQWLVDLAADNSHGYDQIYRWGERGDYDCSSAVISAYTYAGVKLSCTYTGNMKADMLRKGFKDVTGLCNLATGAGLQKGDVLLNEVHHVAMYAGFGMEVEASINENGGAVWGTPGDQTGKEILMRPYRNYPWDCILRYVGESNGGKYMFETDEVRKGSKGASVLLLQKLLKADGYTGSNGAILALDGDFGGNTEAAVKEYQRKHTGLAVDGICGPATWKSVLGL